MPRKVKLTCQIHLWGYEINYAGNLSVAECVFENEVRKRFDAKDKNTALSEAIAWAKRNPPDAKPKKKSNEAN